MGSPYSAKGNNCLSSHRLVGIVQWRGESRNWPRVTHHTEGECRPTSQIWIRVLSSRCGQPDQGTVPATVVVEAPYTIRSRVHGGMAVLHHSACRRGGNERRQHPKDIDLLLECLELCQGLVPLTLYSSEVVQSAIECAQKCQLLSHRRLLACAQHSSGGLLVTIYPKQETDPLQVGFTIDSPLLK